jgi:hypothetical protein
MASKESQRSTRPLLSKYPLTDRETNHDANRQHCQNIVCIVCQSQLFHPVDLHAWVTVDLQ